MICRFCETENQDNATYCKSCGRQLHREQPTNDKNCTNCGHQNPSDATFCRQCGYNLYKKRAVYYADQSSQTVSPRNTVNWLKIAFYVVLIGLGGWGGKKIDGIIHHAKHGPRPADFDKEEFKKEYIRKYNLGQSDNLSGSTGKNVSSGNIKILTENVQKSLLRELKDKYTDVEFSVVESLVLVKKNQNEYRGVVTLRLKGKQYWDIQTDRPLNPPTSWTDVTQISINVLIDGKSFVLEVAPLGLIPYYSYIPKE